MRFLCISDIHGSASALEAVLAEAKHWGYDQLLCGGDHLFPGPQPLEVWKLLLEHQAVCVQGAGDHALARLDPRRIVPQTPAEQERLARMMAMRTELGELILARLGRLPPIARLSLESGHEMAVVHGSPMDPLEPISHDLSDEEIGSLVGHEAAELILCGGSHVPFQRQIEDLRLVGLGSVGEALTPGIAHATIVTSLTTQTSIEQYEVALS